MGVPVGLHPVDTGVWIVFAMGTFSLGWVFSLWGMNMGIGILGNTLGMMFLNNGGVLSGGVEG